MGVKSERADVVIDGAVEVGRGRVETIGVA